MDLPPINRPIRQSKQVKTVNATYLGNIALDIWRLRNRISKIGDKITEDSLKPLIYSLDSCERNLSSMGIETKDNYTGEVYKNSMNVDVVTYESAEMESSEAIVKETIEPAILIQDVLFHKAKVVVVTPKT